MKNTEKNTPKTVKIVKTPLGEVFVTVNEKMVSHQNDPFIQRKVAEASKLLKGVDLPLLQ